MVILFNTFVNMKKKVKKEKVCVSIDGNLIDASLRYGKSVGVSKFSTAANMLLTYALNKLKVKIK